MLDDYLGEEDECTRHTEDKEASILENHKNNYDDMEDKNLDQIEEESVHSEICMETSINGHDDVEEHILST